MNPRRFAVEVLQPVVAVVLLGLLLVAAVGVWPPMVAVESGSMQPHLRKGDLVVVTDPARYGPGGDDGLVTAREAEGYRSLGGPGDVVVFAPPDRAGAPIIHRLRFHVEAGENWYDEADPAALDGAPDCEALPNCPAPHAGYVTRGDHNGYYDQVRGVPVVKREWIRAEARVRVPWLGWVRLAVVGAA